jgi:hypothetical protein
MAQANRRPVDGARWYDGDSCRTHAHVHKYTSLDGRNGRERLRLGVDVGGQG